MASRFGWWWRNKMLPGLLRRRVYEWSFERAYRTLIAKAKDDDERRADLVQERDWLRLGLREEREILRTQRVLRIASRYPTVLPPARTARGDQDEDDNWVRAPVYDEWILKPVGLAAVWRQIEDARKRRREAIESWLKIGATLVPWAVALGSLALAGRLASLLHRP